MRNAEAESMEDGAKPDTHGRAIVVALVQQAFVLLIAALMLDGGQLLRAMSGALAVSWIISFAVLLRHRDRTTQLATGIVKYGFWFVILLMLLVHVL